MLALILSLFLVNRQPIHPVTIIGSHRPALEHGRRMR